MVSQENRNFSLYNFFSVLLPGVAFILAVLPLFPTGAAVDPVLALFPLIVGGFVIGQALHSFAVIAQKLGRNETHREIFIRQFDRYKCDPDNEGNVIEYEPSPTVDAFYLYSRHTYPELRLDSTDNWEKKLRSLYILVNSRIHSEAKGRSRIMQAIYAFCRSIWVATIILVLMYLIYCVMHLELLEDGWWFISERYVPDRVAGSTFPYETIVADSEVPIGTILYTLLPVLAISHVAFAYATKSYKTHYVQYLISDFISLQNDVVYGEIVEEMTEDGEITMSGSNDTEERDTTNPRINRPQHTRPSYRYRTKDNNCPPDQ